MSKGDLIVLFLIVLIGLIAAAFLSQFVTLNIKVQWCRKSELGYYCQHRPGECGETLWGEVECKTRPATHEDDYCITHQQWAHLCHHISPKHIEDIVKAADVEIQEFDRITGGPHDRRKQR